MMDGPALAAVVDMTATLLQRLPATMHADASAVHEALTSADDPTRLEEAVRHVAHALRDLSLYGPVLDFDLWLQSHFQDFVRQQGVVQVHGRLFALVGRRVLGTVEEALKVSLHGVRQALLPMQYLEARRERAADIGRRCSIPEGRVTLGRVCMEPEDPCDSVLDICRTVIPAAGEVPGCLASAPLAWVALLPALFRPQGAPPCIVVPGCSSAVEFLSMALAVYVGPLGAAAGMVNAVQDLDSEAAVAAAGALLATGVTTVVLAPRLSPALANHETLRLWTVHLRDNIMPAGRAPWADPRVQRLVWERAAKEPDKEEVRRARVATRPAPAHRGSSAEDASLLAELLQDGASLRVVPKASDLTWAPLSSIAGKYADYRASRGFYGRTALDWTGSASFPGDAASSSSSMPPLSWSTVSSAMAAVLGDAATNFMVIDV